VDADQRVILFDTTLRDGEQSPGISLNSAEKLEIAQQLARLGVDVIEAGFPIASPGDFDAVRTIARRSRARSSAGCAALKPPTWREPGRRYASAARPRIHTFISTSDIHIEHQLRSRARTSRPGARAAVSHAGRCARTSSSRRWTPRAPRPEFTAEVLQIAIDEGATTINIPTPSATPRPTSTSASSAGSTS
jgi:2-isopropylmalate synthase